MSAVEPFLNKKLLIRNRFVARKQDEQLQYKLQCMIAKFLQQYSNKCCHFITC